MSDVTNTSRQDPVIHLAGAMIEGPEDYLLGVEARGAREVVASEVLPAEAAGLGKFGDDGWPEFEALGFVKGEPVPGDDLFVRAKLPPGWARQFGSGSMWTYIIDDRGIRRAAVFYKAAFYDRRAHMNLIKPGQELANGIIYGDDPVELPGEYALLTDDERRQFIDCITQRLADIEEYPGIYADTVPRVRSLAEKVGLET